MQALLLTTRYYFIMLLHRMTELYYCSALLKLR
jgi:hypothetical protein